MSVKRGWLLQDLLNLRCGMYCRHYARCVARILDPDMSLFGIRILSRFDAQRDQHGNWTKGLREVSAAEFDHHQGY